MVSRLSIVTPRSRTVDNGKRLAGNLIHKCFYSKDTSSLLSAFKTYVRPIVECNSVVWNPFLIKDITTIEAVQRRFTKRIPEKKHLTYHQCLSKLKLEHAQKVLAPHL